jgi:histidine ammonia-lyase
MKKFSLGCDYLSINKLFQILDGELQLKLSDEAIQKVQKSKNYIDKVVNDERVVYGINTGFGVLCDQIISAKDVGKLQENLLKSHSVGVGAAIPEKVAKLMLITKVHSLAQGYSGVALETIKRILWHIEENIIPIVPEKGSVGASGDLAPLSHLFLPLIGLGEIIVKGEKFQTKDFFAKNNIAPLALQAKEGLALINGTQFMASFGALGLYRFHHLLEQADIIAAMTIDATSSSVSPFDPRLHKIRPFMGNKLVAQRLLSLLRLSEINASHKNCKRVQDPYSLRCVPQIHGASRNAWLHGKEIIETELNSVTDNPIVFSGNEIVITSSKSRCGEADSAAYENRSAGVLDIHRAAESAVGNAKRPSQLEDFGEVISGGGFHGQPIALVLDYATLAAAEIGNVSDRRCYLMLEGAKYGLPAFLLKNAGLNSGFMIPQYTTAALVSENKSLCFPASADSIPTSLGQEDHVSMGSIGARKFNLVLDNLEYIQAIELMYAAQALEFKRPNRSSDIIEKCFAMVRDLVEFKTEDTVLCNDINALHGLIVSYKLQKLAKDFNAGYEDFIL